MPTFDHNGMHINYEESGQGESLLAMPGWGGTIDELMPVRQALAKNYRVIAADLPGSGKSGPQPRTYAPGYFQEDARAMLALLNVARCLTRPSRRLQRRRRVRARHGRDRSAGGEVHRHLGLRRPAPPGATSWPTR